MRAKEVDISPFSSNKITIKMFSRSIFFFAYDPTSQTEVNQWHRETGVIYATPVSPESSYTYGLQHNANTLFLQRYFPFFGLIQCTLNLAKITFHLYSSLSTILFTQLKILLENSNASFACLSSRNNSFGYLTETP